MESLRLLFDNDGLEDYDEEMVMEESAEVVESVPVVENTNSKEEASPMVVETAPASSTHTSPDVHVLAVDTVNTSSLKAVVIPVIPTPSSEVPAPIAVNPDMTSTPTNEASGTQLKKTQVNCRICNKSHPVYGCPIFKGFSLEKRIRQIVLHRYCSRCFSPHHVFNNCQSKKTCKHCKGKHHSLLHVHKRASLTTAETKKMNRPNRPIVESPALYLSVRHLITFSPTTRVLLKIQQKYIPIRAVIDLCCARSYICDELVKDLKLPTIPFGSELLSRIHVRSIHDPKESLDCTVKVTTMQKIKTPLTSVDESIKRSFVGLQLADPNFNVSGNVALVIGPEFAPQVLKGNIIANPGLPVAQYTIFGWVISGPSPY